MHSKPLSINFKISNLHYLLFTNTFFPFLEITFRTFTYFSPCVIHTRKVSPSTFSFLRYCGTEYYVKAYVQFKVKSGNVPKATSKKQNEVIFGNYTATKNLESHKTVTYCDEFKVNVSGNNGNIAQMGITDDSISNIFVKSK